MRSKFTRARNQRGAGVIVMVMLLGFFVIGVIGLFGFEITRNQSARDELRSACEAASLAGAAALASFNPAPGITSQQQIADASHTSSADAAEQAFVSNTILGNMLANTRFITNQSGSPSAAAAALRANPAPDGCVLFVEFLDVSGNPVAWSDPTGRTCHVVGVYGEQPAFGKYVGISQANVWSDIRARVPDMDIVMCFDCSSSIDDQTYVTAVNRILGPSGKATYNIVAEGQILAITNAPPVGSSLNAERPQALDAYPTFSPTTRSASGVDAGSPPGPPGPAGSYTDVVVNLDGNKHFTPPYTYVDPSGARWHFPDLGALVEASRGNLESASLHASSRSGSAAPVRSGYMNAYWQGAHDNAQPIGKARQAAMQFFKIMNNNTNAHFGFVSFSTNISTTTPSSLGATKPFAYDYSGGYTVNPPFNGCQLGPANYNQIVTQILPNTVADGGTNIAAALQEAVRELIPGNGLVRKGASTAIIFFTDGQPNPPVPWDASQAQANGIPIYTIGLAQNPAIIPKECDNLNDQQGPFTPITYTDPVTGAPGSYTPTQAGMSGVAGHGGKFFLVTNSNDLNYVFENIARQLVQLSKG